MEDDRIVELFWRRDQQAVEETLKKYRSYCYAIAQGILNDSSDAEETVNDACLGVWNSIPPHRPQVLSAYVGKLTRRMALNRWKQNHAEKRGGGEIILALEELGDCVAGSAGPERELEARELEALLEHFVRGLPRIQRQVFVCRYWYLDPVADIARRFGFTQSKVKSMLHRTRQQLRIIIEQEDHP